jgi:hypothetical protein
VGLLEVWLEGSFCLLWKGGGRMERVLVGVDISEDSFSAAGQMAKGTNVSPGIIRWIPTGSANF